MTRIWKKILVVSTLSLWCWGISTAAFGESAPQWVKQHGRTEAYPAERFLVGFSQTNGKEEAVESAKQQASADLARQISVQIESSVVDYVRESNGRLENELTASVQSISEIRLEGVRYEIYRKRKKVYALAVLERLPAAVKRRKLRDGALSALDACVGEAGREAKSGRPQQAIDVYRSCKAHLAEGLDHESVASAILQGNLLAGDSAERFSRHSAHINERMRAIPHEDAKSLRSAADGLAMQLARAGVGRGQRIEVGPFTYASYDVSSALGRELGIALETAIGRSKAEIKDADVRSDGVRIFGSYREAAHAADLYALRVVAREARTGRLIASAELSLAQSAIRADLRKPPENFEQYLHDSEKLEAGEYVSGNLRVDVRTNKGSRGLLFESGEEMSLFVRVNQPAWVKLVYVLASGDHVPIDQAWFIDGEKANQFVEYRSSFVIVAPFGIEMIHAMASTDRPDAFRTRKKRISGELYDVLDGGSAEVIRSRGLARKVEQELAETTLKVTTASRRGN